VRQITEARYQGELNDVWLAAPLAKPDRELYQRFRSYLIAMTQLNGSFYKPLNAPDTFGGLMWHGYVLSSSSPAEFKAQDQPYTVFSNVDNA